MGEPSAASSAATVAFAPVAERKPQPGGSALPSFAGALSGPAAGEGRFPPGTMLAGRYRIVSLLGKGGMGEVYRATDLALGQPVALKFLPETLAGHPTMIARFYSEVRTARKVSHPNVCRVYDIGEMDGALFISMEYVDGEDLSSLLRRIGLLPAAKATEIARKLCAGLAAAHDKGILHRDLKPANIMLDSQGQVYIMDFGLAGIAAEIEGAEIRNGTPAYMAPEQLAGREVTARSDIYALGLVLYELYTGKRPFAASSVAELIRQQQQSSPESVSSQVHNLDPAVERAIARCLRPDPAARPASALSVAASLPGGNPLAEMLAAGETPSPELVAESGATEGMAPKRARIFLAAALAGTILAAGLVGAAYTPFLGPLELSPEVAAHKARETEKALGYTDRLPGSVYAYDWNRAFLQSPQSSRISAARPRGPDQPMHFWFRESPRPIALDTVETQEVSWSRPAFDVPGMRRLRLDSEGNLLEFEAIPQPNSMAENSATPDWAAVLRTAGLKPEGFSEAAPLWTPSQPFDARMAWTGTNPGFQPNLRVEAAAWKGRLVWFRLIPAREKPQATSIADPNGLAFVPLLMFLALLTTGCGLAWRNLRANRGDRKGATAIALTALVLGVTSWILGVQHVSASGPEFTLIVSGIEITMLFSAIMWVLYLAIEPYIRRFWPQALVTWARLTTGRIQDPLVGSDILTGALFGIAWAAVYAGRLILGQHFDRVLSTRFDPDILRGLRYAVASVIGMPLGRLRVAFFALIGILALRLILRRKGLAALTFVLLASSTVIFDGGNLADVPWSLASNGGFVFLLTRFGLLCGSTAYVCLAILTFLPMTLDPGAWYSGQAFIGIAAVAAICIWAYRTTIGGTRPPSDRTF